MKNGEVDSDRVATAESEQTATGAAGGDSCLPADWTADELAEEGWEEARKKKLTRQYARCLEKVDRHLGELEDMESPIESWRINTTVENAGKTLLVEIDLPGFPTFRLPQPASLARRCERIAHRVAESHWHDAESLHVAVLGDEVVDESLLDLDTGSED